MYFTKLVRFIPRTPGDQLVVFLRVKFGSWECNRV